MERTGIIARRRVVNSFPCVGIALADIFREGLVIISRPEREREGDDRIGIDTLQTMGENILLGRRLQHLAVPCVGLAGTLRHVFRAVDDRLVAHRQVQVCRTITTIRIRRMVFIDAALGVDLIVPRITLAREDKLTLVSFGLRQYRQV